METILNWFFVLNIILSLYNIWMLFSIRKMIVSVLAPTMEGLEKMMQKMILKYQVERLDKEAREELQRANTAPQSATEQKFCVKF